MKNKKVLLLTGATSDIGIAMIDALIDSYDVIVAHYCKSKGKAQKLIEKYGAEKIVPITADFSSESETEQFVHLIRQQNLEPNHFVHLPALPLITAKFGKTDWNDFENELNISFRSAVMICQEFLPIMAKRKGGRCIFMLSHNVLNQPPKYTTLYTTTKYALMGLMKCLAVEYADKYVTINAVSPAMIKTEFLKNVPEFIIEKNAQESPIKRNLYVEEVIGTFKYLLSEEAGCVTGQNIGVTAGK
ncbi:MAG: SDR family NAD(P)-dependent oxidoreductase [Suilimivivens sp.]